MKCVRDEDNYDTFGGKGNFMMAENFKVILLSNRDINDEDNHEYSERMNMDHMEIIEIIQND